MKSKSSKKEKEIKKESSDKASSSKKSRKRKESSSSSDDDVKRERSSSQGSGRSDRSGSSASEDERRSDEDVKKPIVRQAVQRQEVSASENVQEFLQKHPDLSLTAPKTENPEVKIYSEEEVFILQCHNSINPEKFLSQRIALTGDSNIRDDGILFNVDKFPDSSSKTVTLVSSQEPGSLTAETFPVVGKISVSQIIETHEISYDFTQDNNHEEFPDDLRVRHPLLGVNFEEKLAEIASVPVKAEPPEESPKKSKKRNREDSSPEKKSPSKKKIKQEISSDLQWIQNV